MSANQTKGATALATVMSVETPVFVTQRPIESILRDVTVDMNNGNVTVNKGNRLTADEIGLLVVDSHNKSNVAGIMRANFVRLSRGLPPIKGDWQDMGTGKDARKVFVPSPEGKAERTALDYVKAKLLEAMGSGSFYNMLQVVDAIDTIEINSLGDVSPYSVKDAIPLLRATGALPPAKAKLDTAEKFKISVSRAPSLVRALKDKASQATVEQIGTRIVEGRKSRTGSTGGGKGKGGGTPEPVKAEHTPDTVKNAIVTARGQWELAVKAGATVADMRKVCREEVIALAKLGGFDVVELKTGK